MGNETSGFAVLNLSSYSLHIGLSMAATVDYENNVNHGEIFYRRPGAFPYTVYAQTAPEISDDTCTKEIAKAGIVAVTSVGAAVAVVISLPALPALTGPASSLVLGRAEGGALVFAVSTATVACTAAMVDYKVAKDVVDVFINVEAADMYAVMRGCYGGGSGTWLVLRGGLKRVNGHMTHDKLRLEKVQPEYILANGKFTSYSGAKFYTTDEAKKHKAAGHSCPRTACNLLL